MRISLEKFLFLAVLVATNSYGLNPVRAFLQENRLDEAVAVCRQFEVLSTNDADTLFACAWAYFRSDRAAAAEKILEKTKKSAHLPEYQMLAAYNRVVRKQYDQADKMLELLISEHKGTKIQVQATAIRAEIKELRDQLPSAAFIYTGVLREEPNNGRAHWALGRHYKNRGDIRLAIQHLEKTTKLWPKHVESRFELAMLYLEHGGADSLTDAGKWLTEAYRLNKADPRVLEQLGIVFERNGKIVEAVKYWQKAVEIKKDLKLSNEKLNEHFAQMVDELISNQRWTEALAKIDGAGKSITEQPKYILRRAIVMRNLGQYQKASLEFLRYMKTNANDATAFRELGICYVNLKQLDTAYNYFIKAVNQEPDNGLNYAWLAYGLESKGEWYAARDSWKKAVDLLREPHELQKATRKLSSIEKKLAKRQKEKQKQEQEEYEE